MEKTILKAAVRREKPNRVRNAGFIPGVLNGPGTVSSSVQFENQMLKRVISKHGSNAKVWVDMDGEKKFGFIKDIQKDPVEGKILHVAIQLVSENQEVKMQLPVIFHGLAELEHKLLHVEICRADIEIQGKMSLIPETISVDVSEKNAGDSITAADFHLASELKVLNPESEIYAVIKSIKEVPAEETEEAQPAAE